jgi:hypothetical protein
MHRRRTLLLLTFQAVYDSTQYVTGAQSDDGFGKNTTDQAYNLPMASHIHFSRR